MRATKQDHCLTEYGGFAGVAGRHGAVTRHFSIEYFVFLHSCRFVDSDGLATSIGISLENTGTAGAALQTADGPEVAQQNIMSFATVVDRVRLDFVEMPEMELTLPQAVRLWSLGMDDCRFVIDSLVDAGFLAWTPKRTIVRKGRDPFGRQNTQTTDISVPVVKRHNKSVWNQ